MKIIYAILLVCASSVHAMDEAAITLGCALQQVARQKKRNMFYVTVKKEFSEILHFPFDHTF